jgi:signal transduction histidine kinase/CheY-like chemotaxis protein
LFEKTGVELVCYENQTHGVSMKTIPFELSHYAERNNESAVPLADCSPLDRIGRPEASMLRDLQEKDQRKDRFLAILGHELRNPLAPIRNAMQVLRIKGADDPEIEEMALLVERQIEQLTRLIDDLVEISCAGACGISLRLSTVDLKLVVARAVENSRSLIESRQHILTLVLPENAVEVEGDPGRLVQVVSNLLNNSAKYSDCGGQIELRLEAIRDRAVLSVRDAGIGIEPAMLASIFDLFIQVNHSSTRAVEGLGIGLALVRNIVELHGGSVLAASAGLGSGTELVVSLPLLRDPRVLIPVGQENTGPESNAPARRILVVDDNRDATDSMATLLRHCGHDVRTAYDGQTAFALAEIETPDVVICDINMPGISGYKIAHHLRNVLGLRDALLIALSGFAQDEDRHRAQEAGFDAHLAKPVRLDNLKRLLATTVPPAVSPSERPSSALPEM